MSIQIVILAAGCGKRMHSDRLKVLHCIGGKPLLQHVLTTALTLSPSVSPIVVYGHQGEIIRHHFSHQDIRWIEQKNQAGTAHAVLQTIPTLLDDLPVLVLYGDVPLVSVNLLQRLIEITPPGAFGMITAILANARGYGRILRDNKQQVTGIIEDKEASASQQLMTEINTGIYLIPAAFLKKHLPMINNNNQQQEYYLTDLIAIAKQNNMAIHTIHPEMNEEILGVNDCAQLAYLERFYQHQLANKLMQQGVTLLDPARLDVRGELSVGRNVVIDVDVIIEGRVVIGDNCIIGSHVILRHTILADHVEVKPHSIIDSAEIAAHCLIGPFARLRPGTVLAQGVHVGNFVEIKNSEIGENSKINHLSYFGDGKIGARVNIGAGTITCNYDGYNKHRTTIGNDVHIGSDTQLVAPVMIGDGATIGAGSTIIKDVANEGLTLTQQLNQRHVKSWQRPAKQEIKLED